ALKGCNGFIEIVLIHPHILTYPFGPCQIAKVMSSKNFDGHGALRSFQNGLTIYNVIFGSAIGESSYTVFRSLYHLIYFQVLFIVGNTSPFYNTIHKNLELLHIIVVGGKNIYM